MQAKELPDCTALIIESLTSPSPQFGITTVASKLNDMEVARVGGGTQVSALRRMFGDKNTNTVLSSLIIDLLDYYNVKNSFSDGQIRMTVELINSDFWYLKIEQIARACHLQKTGRLLKIYERLDPSVIVEMIQLYEKNMLTGFYETEAVRYKEGHDPNRNSLNRNIDAAKFNAAKIEYLKSQPKEASKPE